LINLPSVIHFLDLVPLHFQRLRDKFNGLFGFLAALGERLFWPADRAQYASPFDVPGLTLGPPSLALPA
jgi:hypothetical protein